MPAPDSSTARSLRRRVTRLGTPRIGSAGGAAGARLGQPVERAKLAPVIEYAPMVDAVIAPHVVEADLVHVLDVARIIALRRAELHGQALIAWRARAAGRGGGPAGRGGDGWGLSLPPAPPKKSPTSKAFIEKMPSISS